MYFYLIHLFIHISPSIDIQLRMAMTEYNLQAEVLQMLSARDLQHRGAGREEVELVSQNLQECNNEKCEILRLSIQATHADLMQIEKDRQKNTVLDYENERYICIYADCNRHSMTRMQLSKSHQTMKSEVQRVLAEKQDILQHDLAVDLVPMETRLLAIQQIEAETRREESELDAAYCSLEIGWLVSEKLAGEMIEGSEPSIVYSKEELMQGYLKEKTLLSQALNDDYMYRRCVKKIINSNNQKDFEERRLSALERSHEELIPIYAEIDSRLKTEINSLINEYVKEKGSLDTLLLSQHTRKNEIQVLYEKEVAGISEKYLEKRTILFDNQKKSRNELLEKKNQSNVEGKSREINEIDIVINKNEHEFAVDLISAQLSHDDLLFEAYKRY